MELSRDNLDILFNNHKLDKLSKNEISQALIICESAIEGIKGHMNYYGVTNDRQYTFNYYTLMHEQLIEYRKYAN